MPKNDPLKVTRRTRRFEGHGLKVHRHSHDDASHHIGACSPDDRAGRSSHVHREGRHIYDGAGASAAKADFTRRYGKRKGAAIYGATLGIRHRQLLAQRARRIPVLGAARGYPRRPCRRGR